MDYKSERPNQAFWIYYQKNPIKSTVNGWYILSIKAQPIRFKGTLGVNLSPSALLNLSTYFKTDVCCCVFDLFFFVLFFCFKNISKHVLQNISVLRNNQHLWSKSKLFKILYFQCLGNCIFESIVECGNLNCCCHWYIILLQTVMKHSIMTKSTVLY